MEDKIDINDSFILNSFKVLIYEQRKNERSILFLIQRENSFLFSLFNYMSILYFSSLRENLNQ